MDVKNLKAEIAKHEAELAQMEAAYGGVPTRRPSTAPVVDCGFDQAAAARTQRLNDKREHLRVLREQLAAASAAAQ